MAASARIALNSLILWIHSHFIILCSVVYRIFDIQIFQSRRVLWCKGIIAQKITIPWEKNYIVQKKNTYATDINYETVL